MSSLLQRQNLLQTDKPMSPLIVSWPGTPVAAQQFFPVEAQEEIVGSPPARPIFPEKPATEPEMAQQVFLERIPSVGEISTGLLLPASGEVASQPLCEAQFWAGCSPNQEHPPSN